MQAATKLLIPRMSFAPRKVAYNCLEIGNNSVLDFAKRNPTARELLNSAAFTKSLQGSTQSNGIKANFNKINMEQYRQDPEMLGIFEQMVLSDNTFEITDLTQAVEKRYGFDYSLMVKYLEEGSGNTPAKYRIIMYLMQAKWFDTSKAPTVGLITATKTDGHQMETLDETFTKHKERRQQYNLVVEGPTPGQFLPVEFSIFPGYFIMSDTQNYLIHLEQVQYALRSLSFDLADSSIHATNSGLDNAILRLMINKKEQYEWLTTVDKFFKNEYIGPSGIFMNF